MPATIAIWWAGRYPMRLTALRWPKPSGRLSVLAADLRSLRVRLGLTQAQFGTLLGFGSPQRRVSEMECGTRGVGRQTEIICRYLARWGPL